MNDERQHTDIVDERRYGTTMSRAARSGGDE
ncbi:hypothetical protein HALLA_21040 (plasmid) [Halostagnicola larsenii XH-48]|uniref:Uncharacterized protein n=1 Tax=Halostagnicola larsenii XH-48 TaxID=797299 RepID=W0JZM1_9EURY|nr:hypothetical protein HALLA_21040 [Halostagnicola larsenii XH-48]